jgi:hypothetical protein
MSRRFTIPALLILGLAVGCASAIADPIRITGGTLQMTGPIGTLSLVGDRGFTLAARVSVFDGVFAPWEECHFAPRCMPGVMIGLTGQFAGTGVPGVATLEGHSFPNLGLLDSNDHVVLRLLGSVSASAFEEEMTTLDAPFTLNGTFVTASGVNSLTGRGTAALVLRQGFGAKEGLPLAWDYVSARYEFQPAPEPATLVLTALGLAGLVQGRRRRPRKPQ